MDWYYADGDKRVGPLSTEKFQQLVVDGVVSPKSLVWHEGLSDWQTYAAVKAGPSKTSLALSAAKMKEGEHICCECGKHFPEPDMSEYHGKWVCRRCDHIFQQKLRDGLITFEESETIAFAGFFIRGVAKFIDLIIQSLALGIVYLGLSMSGLSAGLVTLIGAIAAVLFFIVEPVLFTAKFGGTPGKLVCSLRVQNAAGENVCIGTALGRIVMEGVLGPLFFSDYIAALFDKQNRALHDRIVNTHVVTK